MCLLELVNLDMVCGLRIALLISLASTWSGVQATEPVRMRIASYNVESLCDTLSNPALDDRAFTPQGTKRWNTERYQQKIRNIARVIDDLKADLLALQEVENETVVRDLMYATESGYNYIHRNSRDRRGMDLVLLYRGSRFMPQRIAHVSGRGLSRELLVVEGNWDGEPFTVVVCHLPSMMNPQAYRTTALQSLRGLTDSLCTANPDRKLVIMGDFNAIPNSREMRAVMQLKTPPSAVLEKAVATQLYTPFITLSRQGFGSLIYRDRRQIFDYIIFNSRCIEGEGLRYRGQCGIFVRDYMIHTVGLLKGYPIRTFHSERYTGGYSDHLPVFIEMEK